MMKGNHSIILAAVFCVLLVSSVRADLGLTFDFNLLNFEYTTAGGAPGKVGDLVIERGFSSFVEAAQATPGLDGEFFTSDEVLFDSARINAGGNFDVVLSAEVFKLGTNDYSIAGTWTLWDASGTPGDFSTAVAHGDIQSTDMSLGAFTFEFNASLYNAGGILLGAGDDWSFTGVAADTDDGPYQGQLFGLDNVDGTLGVTSGRSSYTNGGVFDFNVDFGGGLTDLDAFFAAGHTYTNSNMQVHVVPAPAAIGLALLGLSGVMARRRFF